MTMQAGQPARGSSLGSRDPRKPKTSCSPHAYPRAVTAHTLAEENASTKVLQRCGFTRTAELIDPDEGPVWRWELQIRP